MNVVGHGDRYVAMGSSFAAGPGIGRRAAGSPTGARRSATNYAHLLAAALGLDLCDVTYSGAHTVHITGEPQNEQPPQIDALDGSERLVTVTVGGNDVGYVQGLLAASVPGPVGRLTLVHDRIGPLLDPVVIEARLRTLDPAMRRVAAQIRSRASLARVIFVDYLTVLPVYRSPCTCPIDRELADMYRRVAARLAAITADAALSEGCDILRASHASRRHHAWAQQPWTTGLGIPRLGKPPPYHPNEQGMRAVAVQVAEHLKCADR
jgi:lysophospholipase L1-like esterase